MDGIRAVRRQLALGRLLPLGGARDGTWITEAAAGAVLRHTPLPRGVRLGALRVDRAPGAPVSPAPVAPPPSALPAGPLRISVEMATGLGDDPLPVVVGRVREALVGVAEGRVGLVVEGVDVRVVESVTEARGGHAPELSGSLPVPGVRAASAEGAVTWIAVAAGARVLDVARAAREATGGAVVVAAVDRD
ncbi:hypothetical protein [Streptomyces caatingaensis]|uniref:Nucleopolyhedrovirus P10 family protein n=1 Tax=Streptomyces caatingaensis TaxID=1678637 RepID=A0A0K9XGM4_9ACTN|nr:hypothetical protein [Streptomyces caatingaensis]KNB52540.1 hypothetical protein AC230_07655 [Streptomyces caatingaensis]